ncbi:uncharacterized protein LOC124925080 [Impatiens glandulifera]|uniref:uncharacterized protein LOC124925080 n=1 Tax=Impatiens glandulifera TaxID=253017 RepID=UPI001FB089E0|nr:uncharacterized protein LOC124925080 [Impatiens glandulifera]
MNLSPAPKPAIAPAANLLAPAPLLVCSKCNPTFVLHEECFLAHRYIDHPLHPSHPLTLLPSPTYSTGSFLCNICNEQGYGFCFTCSKCDFDLHVNCAVNSKPSNHFHFQPPKQVHHMPHHTLLVMQSTNFSCRACEDQLRKDHDSENPTHCVDCNIDLHFECATNLSKVVNRKDHEHPFVLYNSFDQEDTSWLVVCDICESDPPIKNMWMYWCGECGIGCHLKCVANARPCPGSVLSLMATTSSGIETNATSASYGSNLVQMISLQNQLSQLQFQTNANAMSVLSHSANAFSGLQSSMSDNLKHSI